MGERRAQAEEVGDGFSERLAELHAQAVRQQERFRAVLELGAALAAVRDLDALLGLVRERFGALVGAEAAVLLLHDATRRELWRRVPRGDGYEEVRQPEGGGIAGAAFTAGETVLVRDASREPRFDARVDGERGVAARAVIAVPLRHVSGRRLGVLEVLGAAPDAFGDEARALVEAAAGQVAAVLDSVLLFDELRRQNVELEHVRQGLSHALHELDVLYDVERAVSGALGESDVLDHLLERAAAATGAAAAAVLLPSPDGSVLTFRKARGPHTEGLLQLSFRPGQGIAGYVAATGETVRVARASDCPQYEAAVPGRVGIAVGAVLCVPLQGPDGAAGALELFNKAGGFDVADERLATLLAGQAGRALARQREREQGERRRRLEAIGQMLSGVLHDLRTPLTIIDGYVQLMRDEDDPAARATHAEVVARQFEHLEAMTQETLAFARGERVLLVRKVYLDALWRELEAALRAELALHGVELVVRLGYAGVLRADEAKLKRLVFNLARNAAQAMPGGGRLEVDVTREGDEVLWRFRDSGPGVPEEIAERLFEPFVTAGKQGGTGLGLALVRQVAEEHGGSVRYRGTRGAGAAFEVRLPLTAQG